MSVDADPLRFIIRVWPKRGLVRSGIMTLIFVPLPLLGLLIFLRLPDGALPAAVAGAFVLLAIGFWALTLFKGTSIGVTDDAIEEVGFFGQKTVSLTDDIGSAVLVHTYCGELAETRPQLIVRNHDAGRMLRMRGTFWTEESMRAVAAQLGVILDEPAAPMTARQLFSRYPGTAYWFEDRPRFSRQASARAND